MNKQRRFDLTLSDFELDSLYRIATSDGISIEELLEKYIESMIGGYYFSEDLERVGYSSRDEETFLQWSLKHRYIDNIITSFEILDYEDGKNPDSREEIEYRKKEIEETFREFLFHIGEDRAKIINQDEELERVREFIQKRKELLKRK